MDYTSPDRNGHPHRHGRAESHTDNQLHGCRSPRQSSSAGVGQASETIIERRGSNRVYAERCHEGHATNTLFRQREDSFEGMLVVHEELEEFEEWWKNNSQLLQGARPKGKAAVPGR